jgi:hypothetical protein
MTPTAFPLVDPDVPGLLRVMLRQFEAGDDSGLLATAAEFGAARLGARSTLVGALCLGGTAFAARLAAQGCESLGTAERNAAVLEAFLTLVEPPPGAPDGHEGRVAEWLVRGFRLQTQAMALLDIVRAELLISAGPVEELPEAALAAMRHAQWALALRGFSRLQEVLQERAPRNVCGMAAMCLHKLGRYVEAEEWAQRGLGVDRSLLAIGPVRSEAELVRQWNGRLAPVVSIICTTYNHERYVEDAIRGFLSQDCPYPFEILIHDDASTDGTQRIIREWQQKYPRVIKPLLQTENQYSRGVRPWELLLARARGEFVATCEGDDFWVDPGKLRTQVGFLKAHPEYSSSATNYYHYLETALSVQPWTRIGKDFVLSQRQLMQVQMVLWFPTLVFRKTFSVLPPERDQAAIGDQFLTSYLGTLGPCAYLETLLGSVRRENEFSLWSPLPKLEKERMRVQTWAALVRMHERLGNAQAVADLTAKIQASTLDDRLKSQLLDAARGDQPFNLAAA